MKARVLRRWPSDRACMGELWIDSGAARFCYTLEDTVRAPGVKVPGETAIPSGLFPLTVDWSVRFQRYMPHVLNVPMFTGIRVHSGNTDKNTEGCILVGADASPSTNPDLIWNCHGVFQDFFTRLESDLRANRECSIEVVNAFQQQAAAPESPVAAA